VTAHEFRPQAWRELFEATQWYLADGGPAVAEQFEWALQRALRLLEFMLQLGSPSYPGVRTWPLRHFPYTLVYRVKGTVINVIAVAHQSREPGYWSGR
jgi:toxin ParE1/3/4